MYQKIDLAVLLSKNKNFLEFGCLRYLYGQNRRGLN